MPRAHDPDRYGQTVASGYDELYGDVADTAAAVQRLAELAAGGPVCELGIGTGRLALALLERGLTVSGIDSSTEMVAQLRAKPRGGEIEVAIGDFADTDAPGGPFALAVLAFNTIFAVADADAQIACLRRVATQLRPGGRFVVEAFVADPIEQQRGQSVNVRTMTPERVELQIARHDPVGGRIERVLLNVRDGEIRLHAVSDTYASPRELDLMARLAGLELEDRWSDWEGRPFTSASARHVTVYRRPD